MKVEIVKVTYKVKGDLRIGKFIKTHKGYIPIEFDERAFLDEKTEIVKEEEIEFDYRSKPFFA